jgi:hypothetical protein
MASVLDKFTEEDLEILLREARRKRTGKKIDWDNMSDADRAAVNKTIHPIAPAVPYEKYPCGLFAKDSAGKIVQTVVQDEEDEIAVRNEYPLDWKYGLGELGIETAPSKGSGRVVAFAELKDSGRMLAEQLDENAIPGEKFGPLAAEAAKRGRPRKNAA